MPVYVCFDKDVACEEVAAADRCGHCPLHNRQTKASPYASHIAAKAPTEPKNAAASSGVSIDREHEEFGKWKDSRPDLKAGTSSRDWDLAWLAWWNRASAAPEAVVPAPKRWPFVESPGEFTRRLCNARDHFDGNMLAAVRYVLIESPPTFDSPSPERIDADKLHQDSLYELVPESAAEWFAECPAIANADWRGGWDACRNRIRTLVDARHAAAELVSLCATSKDGVQPTERRSITVSVGELRASDGTTYCVSLYKPGENIGEGMCVLNTPNKQNAEDEAQAWREWLGIAGVAPTPVPLAELRRLIADDAYAATFQTFGQYRTALLKAIDASGVNTLEPLDRIQRCTLGCGELGQCKANAHGVPSECPARNAGVDLPDGAKR